MYKGSCAVLIICLLCICCLCMCMTVRGNCVQENMKSSPANVEEIPIDDLKNKIKSGKGNGSCVVFHADWCGHCQHLKQSGELEKVAQNNCQVHLVDGDKNDLSGMSNFGVDIKGFPTICVVKGNSLVEVTTGRSHQDILNAL